MTKHGKQGKAKPPTTDERTRATTHVRTILGEVVGLWRYLTENPQTPQADAVISRVACVWAMLMALQYQTGLASKTVDTAPVRRFGGKSDHATALVKIFPSHHIYIEPFAGGLHVLRRKARSAVEVVNDIDRGLMGFYEVVRDPERFLRLLYMLTSTPYSRALYQTCRSTWRDCTDDVERAFRWFIVMRASFSANFGGSWGFGRKDDVTATWERSKLSLDKLHTRLTHVALECDDWRRVLDRWDSDEPRSLAYIDPPYPMAVRRSGKFADELSDDDHRDLVRRLLRLRGDAILSGYLTPLYEPLDEAGWQRYWRPANASSHGHTRFSGSGDTDEEREARRRTERIWVSPSIAHYVAERAQRAGWTPDVLE